MTHIKKAALAACLAGVMLLAAGCGGRSKPSENGAEQSASLSSVPAVLQDAALEDGREEALSVPAEEEPLKQTEEDAVQTDTAFTFQEEDAAFEFDLPPEPDRSERGEETAEDAAPVAYLGELAFKTYAYSADAAYAVRDWPGRVCKSRKQLEDLIESLAEAAPGCAGMLEICDDAFFTEKALLFAAKEESGLYGGSVHAAVREEGTVTICADRVRAYGEISFGPCDELYFLAVDSRQVSVHDTVTVIYKERDWAAYALGNEGVRVAAAGTVSRVNIRTLEERDYDSYHMIVDHDRLGTKIFRSQTELDAWLEAVDTRAVVDLPDEGLLLAEKIRSLQMNFETAGLVLCFTSGVSEYLGAAVDGDTVRLGCRRGGGGCIPDVNTYIVLQPVSLEELGEASRVECRIV